MKNLIPIVNRKDRIIGYKDRKEITRNDIYRVSALWVINQQGEILLAKRAASKSHDPNKWAPAVAGTVEKGETYLQNIKKEAEEELGIRNLRFKPGPKLFIRRRWTMFCQYYTCTTTWPITRFNPDRREISELRWFTCAALKKGLRKDPNKFVSSLPDIVKNVL